MVLFTTGRSKFAHVIMKEALLQVYLLCLLQGSAKHVLAKVNVATCRCVKFMFAYLTCISTMR